MDQERPLFPRVRESFRPLGGEGGGWIYDLVTQWATTTGQVVRTRGGVYGEEEILERNMVLDVWTPLEEMGLQLDTHSGCGETEEPREIPRPEPRRPMGTAVDHRRHFRGTRLTPRMSTLPRARLPKLAPTVTPAGPSRELRPTYAAPVFFPSTSGRVLPNAVGAHAGPSGCVGKGKRKMCEEPKEATPSDSEEEDPEEEPEMDPSA